MKSRLGQEHGVPFDDRAVNVSVKVVATGTSAPISLRIEDAKTALVFGQQESKSGLFDIQPERGKISFLIFSAPRHVTRALALSTMNPRRPFMMKTAGRSLSRSSSGLRKIRRPTTQWL
jgi:hypothetical protein